MEEIEKRMEQIFNEPVYRIVFSNPKEKEPLYKKVVIIKKESYYQIEKYTNKQVFHENIQADAVKEVCLSFLANEFLQMNVFSEGNEYQLKITKKGKVLFQKQRSLADFPKLQPHNRKKSYLLEEGTVMEPLVDMGIFTKDGKVVHAMYDKYKQINKFIEIIEDTLPKVQADTLHIIDFGCGKSYLTFIVYYYLTRIKNYKVHMTGLDLKEEVIKKCREITEKYGYENLFFEVGDINGYKTSQPVDLVISLHACDTATDYALFNAVCWNAKMIISVPCCQHELARQMTGDSLSILQRYGIVKERTAALLTDAVRCNLLTSCGYKTQLLEFVDLSHTPKNLLIRAVKTNIPLEHREKAQKEVKELCDMFAFKPTLMQLLERDL